jgi:hypothetical protein
VKKYWEMMLREAEAERAQLLKSTDMAVVVSQGQNEIGEMADKPMRNHTLMQTIARADRVYPGKVSGAGRSLSAAA